MSKYANLSQHLGHAGAGVIRLGFKEIETILGFSLPESAYRYPAWWSNNPTGHSHSLAWVAAGWRSEQVDVAGRRVTFRRATPEGASERRRRMGPTLFGALKGTVRVAPGYDLAAPTGELWAAERDEQ